MGGKAAHPLMSEIRTLTVMFSLPMQPSEKLVPHFLVQLARFLLHHHRLALNNVRQKPGQNTPECSGQTKVRCQQMAQYENKCQWTECPITSSSTAPPATTPAPSTSSGPTCEVDRNMRACVAQGGSFECQGCTNDITGEPCCSCHGGEDPVTTTETTLTTTTSSQTTGQCKAWCASNSKSWEKKCRWPKCAGCSACSARRLRGSDIVVL